MLQYQQKEAFPWTFILQLYTCSDDYNVSTKCLSYVLTTEYETEDAEYFGFPKMHCTQLAAKSDFSIMLIKKISDVHLCKATNKLAIEMKLICKQGIKLSHYICKGKVTTPKNSQRLKCYTHLFTEKDNPDLCHLTVLFPAQGWWTMFILDKEYYPLMQYQVCATDECKNTIYPYISDTAKELGISLEEENVPTCSNNSILPFAVRFTALRGLHY